MKALAVYHRVYKYEDFETAAQQLWEVVRLAIEKGEGRPRRLYLDVEGHRESDGTWDDDAYELQVFIIENLMPYLSEASLFVGTGIMRNNAPSDDMPEKLIISPAP